MQTALQSVLGEEGRGARDPRRLVQFLLASLAIALLAGPSFAASITINSATDIEFGQGAEDVVTCDADGIDVALESAFDGSVFDVSSVELTDISVGCTGKYLRLTLLDSGGTALDQIVWYFASADSAITASAVAAGTDSTSNDTSGDPDQFYPLNGVTNGNLKADVDAAGVVDVTIETGDAAFTASS